MEEVEMIYGSMINGSYDIGMRSSLTTRVGRTDGRKDGRTDGHTRWETTCAERYRTALHASGRRFSEKKETREQHR